MRLLETIRMLSKRGRSPMCVTNDRLTSLKPATKRVPCERCCMCRLKMMPDLKEDVNLHVTPRIAEYSASKGGGSRHLLVNTGIERIVIKIKCSNNDLYRVSPVYSFLNPGKALRLYIVRDPGPARVDKLVLIYMTSSCKNPREAFAKDIQTERNQRRKTLIALVAHDLPHRLRADP